MKDKIIVALDTQDSDFFHETLNSLKGEVSWVKIGMECFYSLGPNSVRKARELGYNVFLDLKLFDIPTTVYGGLSSLSTLDIQMTNIHALAGSEVMKEARKAVGENCKLIAVTHLTSRDQNEVRKTLMSSLTLDESILHLSNMAYECGLDGVVASPLEVELIKQNISQDFLVITPGIRRVSDSKDDQKRVSTPKDAFAMGSDYIVMGRSITKSRDPKETFHDICEEL